MALASFDCWKVDVPAWSPNKQVNRDRRGEHRPHYVVLPANRLRSLSVRHSAIHETLNVLRRHGADPSTVESRQIVVLLWRLAK
jgi:hypothetical protein